MIGKAIKKVKKFFLSCPENDYSPYIFKRDFLFCLILGLLIMRLAILPFFIYFPKSAFFAKIISYDLVTLLNNQRQSLGLAFLKENSQLEKAAELKAQDMLDKDYFAHQSPEGITGWYWIKQTGYNYQIAGENLAIGFIDSGEVHQAWNDSPAHRQNLLRPDFTDIGIAVLDGDFKGNKVTVVVQLFGTPKQMPQIISPVEAKEPEIPISQEPTVIVQEPTAVVKTETPIEQPVVEVEPVEVEPLVQAESSLEEIPLSESINGEQESFGFNFWGFLTNQYNQISHWLILIAASLLIFALLANLFIALFSLFLMKSKKISVLNFIPRAIIAIIGLGLLSFLDKSLIIRIIPHSLEILGWTGLL